MNRFSGLDDLRAQTGRWRRDGLSVALVPTMGNLHDGHLALVGQARQLADRVVVSIFVNPTQFGPGEDYENYPRTLAADADKLEAAGVQALYHPDVQQMYGDDPAVSTRIVVPGLSDILCGVSRPGHFSGVATIVAKLFHQVEPDLAVFGEKDFQQLLVIRRMVAELDFPLRIVGAPTWREADGLAMSSRNAYLTAAQRQQAPVLYQTLQRLAEALKAGGQTLQISQQTALNELKSAGFEPEYVEIRRVEDLEPPRPDDKRLVALAAARLGKARLIDNLRIELE